MKRSLLVRRTPLKRGDTELRRNGWLRRSRGRRRIVVVVGDVWREGIGPCVVCGSADRVQGHHAIPARLLRVLGLHEFLNDTRNRVDLCERHHMRHESRVEPLPRELLPESVWEFAGELDLRWWIEKHYQPTGVPA